jgi:hypothetical protein
MTLLVERLLAADIEPGSTDCSRVRLEVKLLERRAEVCNL